MNTWPLNLGITYLPIEVLSPPKFGEWQKEANGKLSERTEVPLLRGRLSSALGVEENLAGIRADQYSPALKAESRIQYFGTMSRAGRTGCSRTRPQEQQTAALPHCGNWSRFEPAERGQ